MGGVTGLLFCVLDAFAALPTLPTLDRCESYP